MEETGRQEVVNRSKFLNITAVIAALLAGNGIRLVEPRGLFGNLAPRDGDVRIGMFLLFLSGLLAGYVITTYRNLDAEAKQRRLKRKDLEEESQKNYEELDRFAKELKVKKNI